MFATFTKDGYQQAVVHVVRFGTESVVQRTKILRKSAEIQPVLSKFTKYLNRIKLVYL